MKYLKVFTDFADKMEMLGDGERGRLFTAMLKYAETGEAPELTGNERYLWATAKSEIDRQLDAYAKKVKGAEKARSLISSDIRANQTDSEKIRLISAQDKDKDKDKDKENSPNGENKRAQVRHAHGQYGWVKLTDEQHERLIADFGEAETERCIAYVDEAAQSTGNKNRWKDWYLTVRKCHRDGWGNNTRSRKIPTAAEYEQRETTVDLNDLDAILGKI